MLKSESKRGHRYNEFRNPNNMRYESQGTAPEQNIVKKLRDSTPDAKKHSTSHLRQG